MMSYQISLCRLFLIVLFIYYAELLSYHYESPPNSDYKKTHLLTDSLSIKALDTIVYAFSRFFPLQKLIAVSSIFEKQAVPLLSRNVILPRITLTD